MRFSSNSTSWAREQAWAIRGKCLRWDKWSGRWSGEAAVWDLWVKWMRKRLLCNRKGLHCLVLHCSSMLHMLENMSQTPAWSVLGGVCWVTGDHAVRWSEITDWISSCPEYSERRKQSWLYSSSSVPRAAGDQMNLWKRLRSVCTHCNGPASWSTISTLAVLFTCVSNLCASGYAQMKWQRPSHLQQLQPTPWTQHSIPSAGSTGVSGRRTASSWLPAEDHFFQPAHPWFLPPARQAGWGGWHRDQEHWSSHLPVAPAQKN